MSTAARQSFLIIPRKAEVAAKRLKRKIEPVLAASIRAIAEGVRDKVEPAVLVKRVEDDLFDTLFKINRAAMMPMMLDGYKVGGKLLGKAYWAPYECKAFSTPANEVYGDEEFLARRLRPRLSVWIEKTSSQETKWQSQRIAGIINRTFAGEFGTPSAELAAQILLEKGLADSEQRAALMARTASNWAYNEGATESFIDDGYTTGVWVTNSAGPCEFCDAMEGTYFELGKDILKSGARIEGASGKFLHVSEDTAHPPLHPFCMCTIMPGD